MTTEKMKVVEAAAQELESLVREKGLRGFIAVMDDETLYYRHVMPRNDMFAYKPEEDVYVFKLDPQDPDAEEKLGKEISCLRTLEKTLLHAANYLLDWEQDILKQVGAEEKVEDEPVLGAENLTRKKRYDN